MASRIGIDLINLHSFQEGLGRFAYQLIHGLSSVNSQNEYFVFIRRDLYDCMRPSLPDFHWNPVNLPASHALPWNQLYYLVRSLTLPKLDLFHSPISVSPLYALRQLDTLVTVHDVAFKHFPDTCPRRSLRWWNHAWPKSLNQAIHIVADSESTKTDVRRFFGISPDKICVIYPSAEFENPEISDGDLDEFRSARCLPRRYILFVGSPHKRKNLIGLIRGFRLLKDRYRIPHGLVLTGPWGWAIEEVRAKIRDLRLESEITLTGFIPEDEMPTLYKAAEAFVLPSFCEGFGYPPLEAMARGIPVAMSRGSSLSEVGMDAALYFDPHDPEDIATQVARIIQEPGLAEALSKKGFERAAQFTMKRMIQGYLDVYRRFTKRPRQNESAPLEQ